ncbi:MAG TPA: calcium-binding protein [Acidimicrobiales bacterium]|nr:calcium-binding protein [Acidimicrobiales bacterium]
MPTATPSRLRHLSAVVATLVVAATILILAPAASAAPSNDNLLNAIVITGDQADVTGSNVGATHLSGEPQHAGQAGDASVWYKWTPAVTAWATMDTCGTSFPNVLAVYTGPNVVSLTEVASSAYAGDLQLCAPSQHGAVHFLATAGTTYDVVVDSWFQGSSGDFQLHLNAPASNDAFARARAVPTKYELTPPTSVTTSGWTRYATQEAGEPVHAGSGTASAWLDWAAPGTGTVTMDTCGSNFDTVLAAYTGTSVDALTAVAADDDDPAATCGATLSRISFDVAIGQHYRIAVAGRGGGTGEYTLHVDASQTVLTNDNFADAKALAGTSARDRSYNGLATDEAGENLWFGDFHAGGSTIWYRWTAPSSEPYEVDLCDPETDPSFATVLGVYTGSSLSGLTTVGTSDFAKGSGRCAGTDRSELIFDAVAGTTYSIQVGGTRLFNDFHRPAFFGTVVTSIYQAHRPANDDIQFRRTLSGASASATEPTAGAGAEVSEPAHAGFPAAASVWFDWTSTANSTVRMSTCGSSFDTRLALYRGIVDNFAGGVLSQLVPVVSNDDAGGTACPAGPTTSAVTFTAVAGSTYHIAVDGKAGATGTATLAIQQDPPPYTGWQRIGPVHETGNTFVLSSQTAALPGGDRLLWWNQSDLTATQVWTSARRVKADGTMGPEVDLTPAGGTTALADLAVLPDGRIAGFATRIDGRDGYLEARIYNADLTSAGAPVALGGPMLAPLGRRVVAAPDGTLTFGWIASTTVDTSNQPVLWQAHVRQLAPDGTLRPQVDLSTYGEDAYGELSIGVSAGGTVTAAWQAGGTAGQRVDTRRIAPDGTAGPVVTLDPSGTNARVGVAADGSALLTWLGDTDDAPSQPLLAARMAPDGTLTPAVQLQADDATSNVTEPSIAVSPTGRFFVTWLRQYPEAGANAKQVQGRFVEADGSAGPLLGLSSPSYSSAFFLSHASAAFDRWGNVTTSWTTLTDDDGVSESQARRVAPDSTLGPIADLSHWPENAGATGLLVDPSGVPLVAQVRVLPLDTTGSTFDITVEAEELPVADLTVTGSGTGARAATFTVANGGPRASGGDAQRPIKVTLTPPTGLSVSAASGTGWTCTTGSAAACTRTGTVAAGTSAPPIAVTYGTGAAPTTPAGATVVAGLTTDPNPANDATTALLVPLCNGKAATKWGAGTLTGTAGDDVIVGSAGNDSIDGAGGNDTICAGGGNDSVKGGDGNDTFVEADDAGADVLDGGNGTDTVTYQGRTAGVNVSLDGVANDGGTGEGDNVKAVEAVVGTDANDVLTGGAGADRLVGLGGDDKLDGGGGTDTLAGGAGKDTVLGGGGNDTIDESDGTGADVLDGGSGIDAVTYLGRTAGVTVSLDGVANDGAAGEGDNVKGMETVTGTDYADVITGSAGSDILYGMGGNDTLRGLGGNDVLNGGAGNDLLDGGPGVDVAVFDAGDTLVNIP